MFTGIIEDKGKIINIKKTGSDSYRITVELPQQWQIKTGQSIAVNGACLSVVEINKRDVSFDVMPETIRKTSFQYTRKGDETNLERAMKADSRFEGHIVQGHVDEIGQIKSKLKKGNSWEIRIRASNDFTGKLVEKGSVAVDGISLTVSRLLKNEFEVCIIPLTAQKTILGFKKAGDYVNLEADILGKYIIRYLEKDKL